MRPLLFAFCGLIGAIAAAPAMGAPKPAHTAPEPGHWHDVGQSSYPRYNSPPVQYVGAHDDAVLPYGPGPRTYVYNHGATVWYGPSLRTASTAHAQAPSRRTDLDARHAAEMRRHDHHE